jgi:hypothetical protein
LPLPFCASLAFKPRVLKKKKTGWLKCWCIFCSVAGAEDGE